MLENKIKRDKVWKQQASLLLIGHEKDPDSPFYKKKFQKEIITREIFPYLFAHPEPAPEEK